MIYKKIYLEGRLLSVKNWLNCKLSCIFDSILKYYKKFVFYNSFYDKVPIGSIIAYTSLLNPINYKTCDGSMLLLSDYKELFNVIGATYNKPETDSSVYFNLPDLRGEFLRGLDLSRGIDIGRKLGTYQSNSTSIPNKDFNIMKTNYNNINNYIYYPSDSYIKYDQIFNKIKQEKEQEKEDDNSIVGEHVNRDSILNLFNSKYKIIGGDSETRPRNIALNYIIKFK